MRCLAPAPRLSPLLASIVPTPLAITGPVDRRVLPLTGKEVIYNDLARFSISNRWFFTWRNCGFLGFSQQAMVLVFGTAGGK